MTAIPPRLAYNLDRDVTILTAMASSLTPYLYENEMYGHLAGDLPKLTLGGLLMRLHRLTQLEALLTAEQQRQVQDARINFEAECARWAVHYEHKLQHELQARLEALDQFLRECQEDLHGCASSYPSQAEKRTMIAHLQAEALEHEVLTPELAARLEHVDERLRRLVRQGPFISEEFLAQAYPSEQFWWMYAFVPEERS